MTKYPENGKQNEKTHPLVGGMGEGGMDLVTPLPPSQKKLMVTYLQRKLGTKKPMRKNRRWKRENRERMGKTLQTALQPALE